MIGLIIALVVALGVGGTAVVADNARPGDTLFGLDRAVENVKINLTKNDDKKDGLRVRFAGERIKEIEDITKGDDSDDSEDDKIVGKISSLSDEDKEKVTLGIEETLTLLASLKNIEGADATKLDEIIAILNAYTADFPADSRVWVGDDKFRIKYEGGPEKIEIKDQGKNKTKIEVKTEEGKVKVEIRNGIIEIKSEGDDDNDKGSNRGLEEIEVKIFSDKTTVEVEINDQKTIFTTSETDPDKIIAEIIVRFPTLTKSQIESVMEIENEDGSDDDKDDSEETDDDDGDDDEDDNDSGSNSGSGSDGEEKD